MKIWVDQDGTFYPENWRNDFDQPENLPGRSAYSLSAMAKKEKHETRRRRIEAAERSVLAQYRRFVSDKKRLFIFIHGYNNDEQKADKAYDKIQDRIALKQGDGVLKFYWDGLSAGGARGGSIWFKATGNSQLVGTRGLRKLLNATHGKNIVFITHSRGASVFLSALSDPPYNDRFISDTENSRQELKVYGEPPLAPNDNHIRAILLAPAIGAVDFMSPDRKQQMRDFDAQLKAVHYSVNAKDRVLNKFIGLSRYFNPTDLGLHLSIANTVDTADKRFRHKEWEPMKTHAFLTYVENPQFIPMLKNMNIDVREVAVAPQP